MTTDYPYFYAWKNNAKRATLYQRPCRIVAHGALNSVMIEFENGQREIVSRNAVRKSASPLRTQSDTKEES